jgi:hypothetical protein
MLSYELSEQDYIDFQLDYVSHANNIKQQISKNRILVSIFYIIIAASMLLIFNNNYKYIVSIFIIIAGSYHVITFRQQYIKKVIKMVKKMTESGKADKTLGKKEILLEDDILTYTEETGTTVITIDKLKEIRESLSCIFLYKDDISAFIISKKAFPSKEDERQFYNFIESRIPSRNKSISDKKTYNMRLK